MLIVMKNKASDQNIQDVCEKIEQLGFEARPMPGSQRTAIGITGNQGSIEKNHFLNN